MWFFLKYECPSNTHSFQCMKKQIISKRLSTYINMAITEAEEAWITLTTTILGNNLIAKWNYWILNVKLLFLRPVYTIRNIVFKTNLGHGVFFLLKMLAVI